MPVSYENHKVPEGINVTDVHPLKELFTLTFGILAISLTIIVILSFFAETVALSIPFEYEKEIASNFFPENENKDREIVEKYLNSLADKMAPSLDLPEGMSVKIHFDDSNIVNAFATLGGHITIYGGLLRKIPHENALSMVIAHEISHIKHRHPITSLGRGLILSLAFTSFLGVDGGDMIGDLIANTGGIAAMSYSRDQERESDRDALVAVNYLYGHVSGAADLFKIFIDEEKKQLIGRPEFFNSHPLTQSRISDINSRAISGGWMLEGERKGIPEKIIQMIQEE